LEKYGVENVFQNEKIKEKSKETCLNKYGVENYRKTDEYNEKSKKTNLEKYGYEHPSSSNIIKEKVKLRNNELFGVDYPAQNILILEKMKKTNLEKYLVDNYSKTLSAKVKKKSNYFIKEKSKFERYGILLNSTNLSIDFQCKYCENIFKISKSFSYIRNINDELLCIYCNPILSNTSKKELELLSFIRNNYSGTILTNNRSIISNELDIYLPELEIAFEFNGLYWHSELHKGRNYHISKTNECLDKGINLIHIWEDDWDNKKDIVKSIILNKLGRSNKIFARRCEIKIVNN
jgi:hypothetical protein